MSESQAPLECPRSPEDTSAPKGSFLPNPSKCSPKFSVRLAPKSYLVGTYKSNRAFGLLGCWIDGVAAHFPQKIRQSHGRQIPWRVAPISTAKGEEDLR